MSQTWFLEVICKIRNGSVTILISRTSRWLFKTGYQVSELFICKVNEFLWIFCFLYGNIILARSVHLYLLVWDHLTWKWSKRKIGHNSCTASCYCNRKPRICAGKDTRRGLMCSPKPLTLSMLLLLVGLVHGSELLSWNILQIFWRMAFSKQRQLWISCLICVKEFLFLPVLISVLNCDSLKWEHIK